MIGFWILDLPFASRTVPLVSLTQPNLDRPAQTGRRDPGRERGRRLDVLGLQYQAPASAFAEIGSVLGLRLSVSDPDGLGVLGQRQGQSQRDPWGLAESRVVRIDRALFRLGQGLPAIRCR